MSHRVTPFAQVQRDSIKAAIANCGLYIAGTKADGTIVVSYDPPPEPRMEPVIVPLDPRSRSRDYGTVYFISDGEFIKIGFASDWRPRLDNLQVGNARSLTPLLVLEGGGRMEKHLHWLFRAHRVAGEWFRSAAEILAYIEEHKPDGLSLKDGE